MPHSLLLQRRWFTAFVWAGLTMLCSTGYAGQAGWTLPKKPDPVIIEYVKQQAFALGIWRLVAMFAAVVVIDFLVCWGVAKVINQTGGTAYNTLRIWVYGLLLAVVGVIAAVVASTFGSVALLGVLAGAVVAGFKIVMSTYSLNFRQAFAWMISTVVLAWLAGIPVKPLILGEDGMKFVSMLSREDLERQARKWADTTRASQPAGGAQANPSATPMANTADAAVAPAATPLSGLTLQQQYDALMAEKATLDPKNPEAVAHFNKRVADYNEAKKKSVSLTKQ